VSGTEWAAIIAAAFFGLIALATCLVLLKTYQLVDDLGDLVKGITKETVPLIGGLSETVSGVNVELARVDSIIAGVQHLTATADALVGVLHATVSNPLIKAAGYMAGAAAAVRSAKALKES
jgi:1,4-dihydroxy-2-naphthoate octaprenyltransferase